jgi:hypothetical protein
MKLNPRKTIMKSIRLAGINDFKSDEEMLMAKALYSKMVEGDRAADATPRRRKRKSAAVGPTLAENA